MIILNLISINVNDISQEKFIFPSSGLSVPVPVKKIIMISLSSSLIILEGKENTCAVGIVLVVEVYSRKFQVYVSSKVMKPFCTKKDLSNISQF